jgi:type IV pilus assembly protein PilY1
MAAPYGYTDSTYLDYVRGSGYQSRGMSYVGANDGMLHAFKFGKLVQSWTGKGTNDKAMLANLDASTGLGSETWAFIPKNALPYLKYTMQTDYCCRSAARNCRCEHQRLRNRRKNEQ